MQKPLSGNALNKEAQMELVMAGPRRRFHWLRSLWAELRHSLSWSWLLPLVVIAFSLFLSHQTPLSSSNDDQRRATAVAVVQKPDYAGNLRNDLELYLPLVSAFLSLPLLAREWQYGAIAPLALRKPLALILLQRLGWVLLYLLLVVCSVALVGLWISAVPPDGGTLWPWLWDVVRTVMPGVICISACALLVAVAAVSPGAGYLAAVGIWGLNLFSMWIVAQQKKPTTDTLLYTLNSWRTHTLVTHPDLWWVGKLIWLGEGVLFLALTCIVLRREARLVRPVNE